MIRAQRDEIDAHLRAAEAVLMRQRDLVAKNFVSHEAYEQSVARVAELKARAAAMTAQGARRRPRARQPEIAAAAAQVQQGQARLAQAKDQLTQLAPAAPEDCAGREHLLQYRRMGAGRPAGRVVAARLPGQAALLRAGVAHAAGKAGRADKLHLRRMPAPNNGDHHLHLAARRVHAAGDLFPGRARQAGVHDRGAT